MKFTWAKLRQLIRHRDWSINQYLHPTARLCRRSTAVAPYAIGPYSRVRNSRIGAYTYLTREVRVENAAIDSYCSIGPEAIIGGLGRHPTDHFSTSPVTYSPQHPITRILGRNGFDLGFQELARVDIGPDVWIGARAVIADGVRIGAGAVIGANTFIAKDVPPYAIVYGSPPRIHRFRFPPEVVTRLLASEWWLRAPDRIDVHELLGICSLKPGSDSAAANAVK